MGASPITPALRSYRVAGKAFTGVGGLTTLLFVFAACMDSGSPQNEVAGFIMIALLTFIVGVVLWAYDVHLYQEEQRARSMRKSGRSEAKDN